MIENINITGIIVIVTCAVSFFALQSEPLLRKLIFNPYIVKHDRQWWRFITSGFIHVDFVHLLVNMLVLYSFGNNVEIFFQINFMEDSTRHFLFLYFGALIVSHISTYKKNSENALYNSLGASGAVSAVLFANIFFMPWDKVYLYGVIPCPGIVMGVLYLIYCAYASRKSNDRINHDAHFWGAVYGFVYTIAVKPELFPDFINRIKDLSPIFS